MNDVQTTLTILMALVIGYVIGRNSKKTTEYNPHQLTPKEWDSLQSDTEHNPYDDVHADVLRAIKANKKIEAIKLFRQHHSASLKEAKHAVDAIFENFN